MHRQGLWFGLFATAMTVATPASARVVRAAFIPAGDVADAPSGFIEMCHLRPDLCGGTAPTDAAPVPGPTALGAFFTSAATATLSPAPALIAAPALQPSDRPDDERVLKRIARQVNQRVNGHTRQRSDMQTYGVEEHWQPSGDGPQAVGDCEDLALQKQAELLALGVPKSRLRLAAVFRSGVGLHTVLIVRRPSGDYVLDSRTNRILRWEEARYSWLRVQSGDNPLEWRRVAAA